MNAQDYRQVYRVCERAGAELRGIVSRLKRERDDEAAVIVEGAIGALSAATQQLLSHWRAQQEAEQVKELRR